MIKVCVIGGGFAYEMMYEQAGFELVRSVEEANLVQFTGGADVDPFYYGERKHGTTHCSPARDAAEEKVYKLCKEKGIPMVGICRGAQFLNVMNGGTLYQNVNNHAIAGTHEMVCKHTGQTIDVSSTHHQMMRKSESGELLGYAKLATLKEHCPLDGEDVKIIDKDLTSDDLDTEVVFYKATKCLCYQPHPEIMSVDSDCRNHFIGLVKDLLV